MKLRRFVGSVIAAVLLGSTLSLPTSVPPATAASGTPIVLPLPGGAVYSIPFVSGGSRVAGAIQSDYSPVVWDFSGTAPTVISPGLPPGATQAFILAINDSYAAGFANYPTPEGRVEPVLWSLTDVTNPSLLGVPTGWTGVSPSVMDGNWLVGTGVDGSGQPHAIAWNLPNTEPIDLGFLSGKATLEVNAVVGTWAVGMIADSTLIDGFFQTPVNPRPVAWNLAASSPSPILLPKLETFEFGSTKGIVSGTGGTFAVGNFERGTFGFEGYEKRAVAWKLDATPSAPVDLGAGKGVDKASGGWVIGNSSTDVVAWDLSQWNGTDSVPASKVLGSLSATGFQVPIVNAVVDDWVVGNIYVQGVGQPVVWDLSKANPVPVELTGPDGDPNVSAFSIAGDFIIGSRSDPPSPENSFRPDSQTIAWKLSELDGGGGGGGEVTSYTVTVTEPTNGSITSAPAGINCGTSGDVCSITVAPGTEVTLTATADSGKVFNSWGGSCSGSLTTCTLTVSANRTVTASFDSTRTLTINSPTNARITSTTVPPGANAQLNCGNGFTICSASVVDGSVVQLRINVNQFYALDEWTGCDSVTDGVCSVTIDEDVTIGASLKTLGRLWVVPSGGGPITSTDGKIDCRLSGSGSCFFDYAPGTQVTLTTPSRDDLGFLGWTGATCSEGRTGLSCTVTISALTTTTMRTTWEQLQAVTVTPNLLGTVTSTDGRFNCGVDQTVCKVFYRPSPSVTFSAIPKPGHLFTGWKEAGGCLRAKMSPTCTVNKWTLYSAEATFAEALQFTVTRRSGGTITSSDGKIKCGTVSTLCSALVPKGGTIDLVATPDVGNELAMWLSPGCQSVGRCTFPIESDMTFEGMEFRKPATLTLQTPANGRVSQWNVQNGLGITPLNCGLGQTECAATYMVTALQGQQVFLEAKAAPGWHFSEWVGCDSLQNSCVLNVVKNTTVTAKFVQATKLTVPQDTGGTITSTDRRIKCAPGFGNCVAIYQGAPRVSLQVVPLPDARLIVVGWKGCSINSWAGWAGDNWTATSSGCSLIPGANSIASPLMSTLPDATSKILSKASIPSATRLFFQNVAEEIQFGRGCTLNLATFVRELTLLHNRGNISVADGVVLVAGAKALCPSVGVARAGR